MSDSDSDSEPSESYQQYLYLNATSLFFHNRKLKTPETPAATRIRTWAQDVLPPPAAVHPAKKRRTSTSGQLPVGSVSTDVSSSRYKGDQ